VKTNMKIPPVKIWFPESDRERILTKIDEILESGRMTLGKYNKQFEEEFRGYIGTKYAIAVNSGTSALEIILRSIGIKGKKVIVPMQTFIATPASVIHAGGKVVFADSDQSMNVDPQEIEDKINFYGKDIKAIIVVHLGGNISPNIDEIVEICRHHKIPLVEDASHAHGSTFKGYKAGYFGTAGAFSFYPTKVMTSGEGGMITTDNKEIYKKALILRDQGKAGFTQNFHTELGYNWRMPEINAVLGLSQLHRLDEFIRDRRKTAKIYDRGLKKIKSISPLYIPENIKSNYYKYIALINVDRKKIKEELKDRYNISLQGEVYEVPCHLQPIFKYLNYKKGDLPMAEHLCKNHICLPISAMMARQEAKYVVNSIKEVIR